jgi:hypothetical protein
MEFVNETGVDAGWTLGFEPEGRELLVVAIKATYTIPRDGAEPTLTDEQVPLVTADVFNGEPGFSATLYEADYAHRKPACDVLLNGSAYPPDGRPVEEVIVTLRVGDMSKSIRVVGDRIWRVSLLTIAPTRPEPFTRLPISYDRAFGGVDVDPDDPERRETYLKNPVGVGFYPLSRGNALRDKPLPNTEQPDQSVRWVKGKYEPMAFGPLSRNVAARVAFAGTYDRRWRERRVPLFPEDFDYRYFQAAPPDQQISHPKGGEEVVLQNLTPEGVTRFRLPVRRMPVLFSPHHAPDQLVEAVIDTVVIEPDLGRFTLTWRVSYPLRRNAFELRQVIAGEMPAGWYRARQTAGKRYYANLDELIKSQRRR